MVLLTLSINETTKKIKNMLLFFTLSKIRPIIEHVAKKCRMPKKIKLSLSKKNVTEVITEHININMLRRFKNLCVKLSEK